MKQKFTVLFDLDGTLIDTAPDLITAHNHVMKKFGYPTKTLGELKNAVGKGAKAMMAKANGQWKWFDEKIQNEMIIKKKRSQPSQIKTCGSTFKNISGGKKAGEIIKESGCNEYKEGDAEISKKHCNFFVNNGKANSSDIEKLINRVKKTVNEKLGVNLELEIKIIGD